MPEQGRNGKKRDTWITPKHRGRAIAALDMRRRRRAEDGPRPLSGADLGHYARVPRGQSDNPLKIHEYVRRRTRELVADLRAAGWPIVADAKGYYFAEEVADFTKYQDYTNARAKRQLSRAAHLARSQGKLDAQGQFGLLDMNPSQGGATHLV